MSMLRAKAIACLAGAAVGDALGGATEGWSVEQIRRRYGGPVVGIVAPFRDDWRTFRPMSPYHKGDGHVTDDTMMSNLLVEVYSEKRDHLDAYDIAEILVPKLMTQTMWIPELEAETVPVQRLFLAEKWLVTRIAYGHVDPREAGVGNVVNCGAAMYAAPTGIANAADPGGAYAEAVAWAGAHQSSYGREAAGVFAAAVAAAMAPDASVDSVILAATTVARDGTRQAVERVCDVAAGLGRISTLEAAGPLRDAISLFDTVGPDYRQPGLGARRPSRLHAIEELPIALGMLIVADGDYEQSVIGAINYGRDSDSIATMAGAIAGALGGLHRIPDAWLDGVSRGSRLDLTAAGTTMAEVAEAIARRDAERSEARQGALTELTRE